MYAYFRYVLMRHILKWGFGIVAIFTVVACGGGSAIDPSADSSLDSGAPPPASESPTDSDGATPDSNTDSDGATPDSNTDSDGATPDSGASPQVSFHDGIDGVASSSDTSVRVGIHDTGVDINHPVFADRVATSGVELLYPTTLQPPSPCMTSSLNDLCLFVRSATSSYLIEIPAGCIGANADRQFCAREMLLGVANNIPFYSDQTLYIYDRSTNTIYRLPSAAEMRHGTIVAALVAEHSVGTTRSATIVPLSINASENQQASDESITFQDLLDVVDHRNIDILNRSIGVRQDSDYADIIAGFEGATQGHWLRDYWEAFAQLEVATSDKVVQVWAAGNESASIPNPTSILPYYYAVLRDHWVAVVATGSDGSIAHYSNRCGERSAAGVSWDQAAHGLHYCIAALGDARGVAVPNGQTAANAIGTSFAAPRVTGAIAAVMLNARNQVPAVEAMQRVKQTADRSGIYADTVTYGVGLLDLNAALISVGEVSMSAANGKSSLLGNAMLSTPSVYGAAVLLGLQSIEIAAFDALNYPFWHDASSRVKTSSIRLPSAWEGLGRKPVLERSGLLKSLRWFSLTDQHGSALRMALNQHTFGFSAAPFGAEKSAWSGLRVGFVADNETHYGARARGAFASRVRSGMVFAGFEHSLEGLPQSPLSGWSWHTRLMVAVGKANYAEGALFEASGSLLSSAVLALGHVDDKHRTRFQIEQPLRAESGEGVLHYAYGRTTDGTPLYRQHSFSLVPDARAFHISLGHEHTIGEGRLTVQLLQVLNRDHVRGQHHSRIAAGYQLNW